MQCSDTALLCQVDTDAYRTFVPKWYSHLATLNDAEAVFERFLVVAYRAFPAELRIQAVAFAASNFRTFDDYT